MQACDKCLPIALFGYDMHHRPQDFQQGTPGRGHWKQHGLETMSEQTARPTSNSQAGAKLENLYKPVGIAALTAAALCKNAGADKKKQ